MATTIPPNQRDFSPEAVETAYQEVLAALPAVNAPVENWLDCFSRWDELKRWLDGTSSR